MKYKIAHGTQFVLKETHLISARSDSADMFERGTVFTFIDYDEDFHSSYCFAARYSKKTYVFDHHHFEALLVALPVINYNKVWNQLNG